MEVAPPLETAYVEVINGQVVGVIYMAPPGVDARGPRARLGLLPVTHMLYTPQVMEAFLPEANVRNWLQQIWQRYRDGHVIEMRYRTQYMGGLLQHFVDGRNSWLRVKGHDRREPAFALNQPYVLWDTARHVPVWPSAVLNDQRATPAPLKGLLY
jgi:hypothetical protein